MNQQVLKKLRGRLTEEFGRLVPAIERDRLAKMELDEKYQEAQSQDQADQASVSHSREVFYEVHAKEFERLQAILEAQTRIARGKYGICVHCGEPINEKRLIAVPWAALCIQCQGEAENAVVSLTSAGNLKSED